MCSHACIYVCACVCSALGYTFSHIVRGWPSMTSSILHCIFGTNITLNVIFTVLAKLTVQPQGSASFCPRNAGDTSGYGWYSCFMWVLRTWTQVLTLVQQIFQATQTSLQSMLPVCRKNYLNKKRASLVKDANILNDQWDKSITYISWGFIYIKFICRYTVIVLRI